MIRRLTQSIRRSKQGAKSTVVLLRDGRWLRTGIAALMAARAEEGHALRPCRSTPASGAWTSTTPAIPPEQIIKQFAAKETEFQEALNHYTYRRAARVQTIDDDNKVDGE